MLFIAMIAADAFAAVLAASSRNWSAKSVMA